MTAFPALIVLFDPSFLLGALLLAALLVLRRRWSDDIPLRRRTTVLAGLVATFVVLRLWRTLVPETVERAVRDSGTGEITAAVVDNPVFQTVHVTSLIIGFLVILLLGTLLVVDLLVVRRLKTEVPRILPDVASITVFFFGVLFILYHFTELDITAVFTTSAVLSVVIGLALQDTLGNLFSGLALQTERAFQVGDWVSINEFEGAIADVSWRSTKIRTRDNDLVVIPNAVIAKSAFLNYSAPSSVHAVETVIGCHYRHPPADVIAALEEATSQTEGVQSVPEPQVRIVDYGDSAVTYQVRYWIRDYAALPEVRNALMIRIWYVFARRGIEIPYPMRNLFMHEPNAEAAHSADGPAHARVVSRLRRCDLFRALSDQEMETLVRGVKTRLFFSGETVLRQGDAGDSLYVIDDGRVEVLVQTDGREERVAELGPPSFFGEMSLMTGEPRSGTVRVLDPSRFLVVERTAVQAVLQQSPEVAERISRVLSKRQQELHEFAETRTSGSVDGTEDKSQQILGRIWQIFGF